MPQSSRNTLVYFGGPRALQAYSTMPSEAMLGVWLVIFGCFSEWSPREGRQDDASPMQGARLQVCSPSQ